MFVMSIFLIIIAKILISETPFLIQVASESENVPVTFYVALKQTVQFREISLALC